MSEAAELESSETPEGEGTEKKGQLDLESYLKQSSQQSEELGERFDQLTAELRKQNARPAKETPKQETPTYTAAQLQPLIDSGEITPLQASEYLVQAREAKLREEIRSEFRQELQQQTRSSTVEGRIAEYQSAIPQLADKKSDEYRRLAKEVDALISEDGKPANRETLLEGLRLTFGRNPKKSAPRETTSEHTRSTEASGRGGGSRTDRPKTSDDGFPDYVPEANREYYRKMIERKKYTGTKDPRILKEFETIKRKVGAA